MILTDETKVLDGKIKVNHAWYNLDREAAKISVLSSKQLSKYEHLTGEYLGYKLGVVEQAKFEYFQLGKVLNEGLEIEDEKEKLLKRLKIIKTRIKSSKKKLLIKETDNYMWLISKEKQLKVRMEYF